MSWLRAVARLARRCPPPWKLTRAVSEPSWDPSVIEHLRTCPPCATQHDRLRRLVALAGSLPAPAPLTPRARHDIAARLWATPPRPARATRRWKRKTAWVATAIPVAALIALALVTVGRRRRPEGHPPTAARTSPQPSPQSLASIRAFGDVRFARVQPPPDEIVRLEEGRIGLDITPLQASQRFRVLTLDAVVEVRGTSFELSARQGHLLTASVSRGRVEVKAGGGLAVLDPGDKWEQTTAPEPAPAPAPPALDRPARALPAPAKATASKARARPVPTSRASPVDDSSDGDRAMFARAWSLLRSGDARAAAVAFAELDERARGRSIEEDALYWHAVSVARLKDDAAAARLFADFLQRFPRSGHRGEAAVALGWLRLHTGDVDDARRAFDQAAGDPSAAVRASAAEGLRRTKHD